MFGFKEDCIAVDFKQFITALSQFSPLSTREQKLKGKCFTRSPLVACCFFTCLCPPPPSAVAYALYDCDGDGKISHKDLMDVLSATTKFEGVEGSAAVRVRLRMSLSRRSVTPHSLW